MLLEAKYITSLEALFHNIFLHRINSGAPISGKSSGMLRGFLDLPHGIAGTTDASCVWFLLLLLLLSPTCFFLRLGIIAPANCSCFSHIPAVDTAPIPDAHLYEMVATLSWSHPLMAILIPVHHLQYMMLWYWLCWVMFLVAAIAALVLVTALAGFLVVAIAAALSVPFCHCGGLWFLTSARPSLLQNSTPLEDHEIGELQGPKQLWPPRILRIPGFTFSPLVVTIRQHLDLPCSKVQGTSKTVFTMTVSPWPAGSNFLKDVFHSSAMSSGMERRSQLRHCKIDALKSWNRKPHLSRVPENMFGKAQLRKNSLVSPITIITFDQIMVLRPKKCGLDEMWPYYGSITLSSCSPCSDCMVRYCLGIPSIVGQSFMGHGSN